MPLRKSCVYCTSRNETKENVLLFCLWFSDDLFSSGEALESNVEMQHTNNHVCTAEEEYIQMKKQ